MSTFLFSVKIVLISNVDVVQQVPGWEEGDTQEQTEGPA